MGKYVAMTFQNSPFWSHRLLLMTKRADRRQKLIICSQFDKKIYNDWFVKNWWRLINLNLYPVIFSLCFYLKWNPPFSQTKNLIHPQDDSFLICFYLKNIILNKMEWASKALAVSEKVEKQGIKNFRLYRYMVQGWFICVSVRLCVHGLENHEKLLNG